MRLVNTRKMICLFLIVFATITAVGSCYVHDSRAEIDHDVAESTKIEFAKIGSEITVNLSTSSLTLGSLLEVNGTISPSPSSLVQVTLTYYQPGGSIFSSYTVDSTSDGFYNHTFSPNITGNWKVKASWEGDEICERDESELVFFKVNPPTLNVILFFLLVGVTFLVLTGFLAYSMHKRRFMFRTMPVEK